MFIFKKEQKVFDFNGIKVGGQPGENPPLMISSMFHNKDQIVQDRKGNFDRQRAKEIIRKGRAKCALWNNWFATRGESRYDRTDRKRQKGTRMITDFP